MALEQRSKIYEDAAKMHSMVKDRCLAKNYAQSLKALELMVRYHDGQYRRGEEHLPYIVHPLAIALHAFSLGIDSDSIIAAALLHDVVEDCNVETVELPVSDRVRTLVELLTFRVYPGMTKEESRGVYFKNLRADREAAILKLLDRCNNVSGMYSGFTPEKRKAYILETENYVFPLLQYVKEHFPEYEDASFAVEYQMGCVLDTYGLL